MNINEFANNYFVTKDQKFRTACVNWANKFQERAQKIGAAPKDCLINHEFLLSSFSVHASSNSGMNTYYFVKEFIIGLCHFYNVDELCAPIPDPKKFLSLSSNKFFKSLEAMILEINKAGHIISPESDLLRIKSIAICFWYGLTAEEMVGIKNEWIYAQNGTYSFKYYHKTHGETIKHIPNIAFDILHQYANNEVTYGFPSGKKVFRSPSSKYLFSTLPNGKIPDSSSVRKTMQIFNNRCESITGLILSSKHLADNAKCVELYEIAKIKHSVTNEEIAKVINNFEFNAVKRFKIIYYQWYNKFYRLKI